MPDHFPRREYRCRPGHHRLGCGGSTPPSRCGSFSGLQALQRCSGLLSRRARGSTVATHHFQRSRSSKYQSATLRTSRLQVRVLPGVPISWACGSTRIAEGPDSESGSLGGAIPFMPTISRRLASAGIADPGDLKSPRLPGASPGSPTGVWFTGNSRPIRLKIE